MPAKILFVTQTLGYKAACGIGIIGDLIGKTLQQYCKYPVDILYTDEIATVHNKIKEYYPDIVIYNYSPQSTPWIDSAELRSPFPNIMHVRIMHDIHQGIADAYSPENNYGWEYIVANDPTVVGNRHIFITNRILPPAPTVKYVEQEKPVIGFQGFGFGRKGVAMLAHKVLEEFDEAIIRLHMPHSYYGDPYGEDARCRVDEVRRIISTNPKIDIVVSNDMLNTQELVDMLATNTINCYFYDYLDGAGLASSPDYALAAKRPIAVTRSHQMRHFWDLEPCVLIENTTLKQIISNGTEALKVLYDKFSIENVMNDYHMMIERLLEIKKQREL